MLMNESGSYYEEFRRSKKSNNSRNNKDKVLLEDERILTDRSAYITFLEVQLERVSAACLTTQSFNERIEETHVLGINNQEKTNNIIRSIKHMETGNELLRDELESTLEKVKIKLEQLETMRNEHNQRSLQSKKDFEFFRNEWNSFKESQNDYKEASRTMFEQKLHELTNRLDLEEARNRANESKTSALADITRSEIKTLGECLQNQFQLGIKSMEEDFELRFATLDTRVSKTVDVIKNSNIYEEIVQMTNMKDEMETMVVNTTRMCEKLRGDVFESLHELDQKLDTIRNNNQANLEKVVDSITKRFETEIQNATDSLTTKLNADHRNVHDSIAKLREESHNEMQRVLDEWTNTQLNEYVTGKLETLQQSQDKRIDELMETVGTTLKTQNETVSNSITRMQNFMNMYNLAHMELQERLDVGKQHEQRLSELLGYAKSGGSNSSENDDAVFDATTTRTALAENTFGDPFLSKTKEQTTATFATATNLPCLHYDAATLFGQSKQKSKSTTKRQDTSEIPPPPPPPPPQATNPFVAPGSPVSPMLLHRRPLYQSTAESVDQSSYATVYHGGAKTRDGGGKKGRSPVKEAPLQDDVLTAADLIYGASPERRARKAKERTHSDSQQYRPPWGASASHPKHVANKTASTSTPAERRRRLRQLYEELSGVD